MATGIIHANKASPSFVCNENVFCDLQCKSCSSMKGDIQVLVNEMKSMTEIISILKEELKHHDAASRERRTISTCTGEPFTNSLYCCQCSKLENQLKDALSELSSVKLITEILNDEIKLLKHASHTDSNTGGPWIYATSRNPRSPAIVQQPIEVHATHEIPVACQCALPFTNRYDALSNSQELQEPSYTIFPTKSEQSPKLVPGYTHEYTKGLRRKKIPAVNQHRRSIVHQTNKPNLQKPIINEDGECCIPTIVNGVTNVNPTSVTVPKYSDSTKNRINNLKETIKVLNRKNSSLSKTHRVILIGDSSIKGYACNLQSLLSDNYNVYSTVKPGSTTCELKESAKEEVRQLSHDDVIIICSGTNDYEPNKFSLTFHNIMNFINSNDHTNIILMNDPFRYDLPNSISVNRNISALNRKLQKLVKDFPHLSFLKTDMDRNLSMYHGLHLNKLGKQLVQHQIASLLHTIFEQKTSHRIILGWHEIQDNNNLTCDGHQVLTSNRNSSRNRKLPVTRSNDFLWKI